MTANDRGYGHGRVAGLSTCRQAEQPARAQSYQIPRQPACEHRRVLGARRFVIIVVFRFVIYLVCLNLSQSNFTLVEYNFALVVVIFILVLYYFALVVC